MLNVAMRACDQCTIFSTGEKFCPDYGLLLELHALTLVTRSYALLHITTCLTSVALTCLIFVLDVAQKSRRYFYVRVRAWEEANTEAAIEI